MLAKERKVVALPLSELFECTKKLPAVQNVLTDCFERFCSLATADRRRGDFPPRTTLTKVRTRASHCCFPDCLKESKVRVQIVWVGIFSLQDHS